jgi:hypothetical protein
MVRGECGLCRSDTELRNSHLLPASVYKLARTPDHADPNPIVVTARGAVSSSRQVVSHFLCASCEERFERGGETYVLSQCARQGGSFEIRSKLRSTEPLVADERWEMFDAVPLLGSDTEQYLYFAASVFWRASAKAWTFGPSSPRRCIDLGDRYQEEFRLYLLGLAPFPPRARLFVHVWSDHDDKFTSLVPSTFRIKGTHRHKFCIPGISFILFVGGNVAGHDEGALNGSPGAHLWLCPWENDSLFESFAGMIVRAIRSKKHRPV